MASPEWRKAILNEYQRLNSSDETIHNQELHQYILATWKRDSPVLWHDLQRMGIADEVAYVLQQRMWDRQKALISTGMPVTDAREMAEKEILMLEPEEAVPDRSPPWTPPLQSATQKA